MDLFAFVHKKKPLSALNDREVLALAIQSEEEDGRIYREFAERLQASYPCSADIFSQMAEEASASLARRFRRTLWRPPSADPARGCAWLHPPTSRLDEPIL